MSNRTAGDQRQQAPNNRKDRQKSVVAYAHQAEKSAERRARPGHAPRGRTRTLSALLDQRSSLRWSWLWVTPVLTAPTPVRGPAPPGPNVDAGTGGASP
ncbi:MULTISPECIES: hypothetical protein [Protofrankia]|uniref:hypothetical protein n=1 Tax=Protofrankia TaxID=2994361 RepID=UPI00138F4005|nr:MULTISPECIES: hypothetical protein [Protofrankia]